MKLKGCLNIINMCIEPVSSIAQVKSFIFMTNLYSNVIQRCYVVVEEDMYFFNACIIAITALSLKSKITLCGRI